MKDWALQHPYLTTFIAIFGLTTVHGIVTRIVDAFKRPPPPATVNVKLESHEQPEEIDFTGPRN